MKKGKKASLNMSISTIVVLILAMTLLGFGLMFIKGIFSKAGSQFNQVSGDVEKTLKERLTDTNERLVLMQEDFEAKKGSTVSTYFALRNDLGEDTKFFVNNGDYSSTNYYIDDSGEITGSLNTQTTGVIECYANDGSDSQYHCNNDAECSTSARADIDFKTIKQIKLKQGEVKVFPLTIRIKSSAISGTTYYCKMSVGCDNAEACGTKPYYEKEFTIRIK